MKLVCKICGNEFDGNRRNCSYCSFHCANVGRKVNGLIAYKKRVKEIEGEYKQCIFCGNKNFQIHHVDRNKENNNKENLIPVCLRCHRIIHSKIIKNLL